MVFERRAVISSFLLLSENSVCADFMRLGPEDLSERSCNGHIEVEQRQSARDEDQHNGNIEPTEKYASKEQQYEESPVYPVCNGVDLNELDTETEGRGAYSCGVTERCFPSGLEEGELDQSVLQEDDEDGSECRYRTHESLRNGQSAVTTIFLQTS